MAYQQPQRPPRLEQEQLSALKNACDSDNTAPLERLIETLDPSVDNLKPGLWVAIKHNHLKMVRYLLERGVSVNEFAVKRAIQAKSIPALEILREFGWEVNMKLGDIAMTALNFATSDPALVSYLLKLGANPNLGPGIGPIGSPLLYHLISKSGSILQSAAENGNIESLDLLITHGAVLSYAAILHAAVDGGSIDMIAHVLELGADVDERDTVTTMGWERYGTPLQRAIHKSKTDAVRLLLEKGASTTISTMINGKQVETALELVKRDWVVDEIRKMVEEVGEKGRNGTEKEREVETETVEELGRVKIRD